MTSAVPFHSVPQNSENLYIITIDLSPSSSNCSRLIGKKIVIGSILGIAVAAATAYFFMNKALAETAFSTHTTETSTEYFADSTKLLSSESIQSLYNIVRLVTTEPDYYDHCIPAFRDHWERFKECGVSINECMQNSIKLFGKLFCKPPTNSFGYIDDRSEECENTYFALARCDI
jgi:hypothetical protein